ncbi:MAG: O-antigen ligase family protein [Flavobacteriales bacterium]
MGIGKPAKLLYYSIVTSVVVIWIFPTCRLMLFGAKSSESSFEIIFGVIPEFVLLATLLFSVLYIRDQAEHNFFKNRANIVFVIFLVSNVLLGVLLSMYPKLIVYGFRTTYFSMLFFVVGYAVAKMPREQSLKLLDSIFRIFIFFAVVGLILYFGFPDLVKSIIEKTGHQQYEYFIPRMTSLVWTPVLFGFLMAVTCIYYYLRIMNFKNKIDYLFFGIAWISLFLSVSRGSLFVFIGAYAMVSLYYRNWKILTSMLIIVCSTLLVNTLYFKNGVSLWWIFSSAADTASMADGISRVERWRLSFEAFKQQPMGYGMGHGGATAYRFLINSDIKGAPYSTDGWYLKMVCENGVYGLLSALGMAVYFLIRLIREFIKGKLFIHSFAILFLIMVAVHAVPSNTLDYYHYISVLWLTLGFALNTSAKTNDS